MRFELTALVVIGINCTGSWALNTIKQTIIYITLYGRRGRDRMVVGLQLPVQSVPITTKVGSSNPAHG
jgi:hypothetical protein